MSLTSPDPSGSLADMVKHIWLDFKQMAEFENDPLIVVSGDGIRVQTLEGRELIDGISGAVVTGLGYRNARVEQAMKEQVDKLLFWPILNGTTEPALRLAARLAGLLPGDLNRAFLLSGGSEATECALKMARQYHIQTGNPRKYKVISRYWAYHGSTKGALSASGVGDKRKFDPFLEGYLHALPPYCYKCPFGQPGPDRCHLECADHIERMIQMEGRETVAAVIVDPVMAAAGVLVPPKGYYRRLREICDENQVLLIFDEVLTGFGRLGEWFASNYYEVVPDIICLGKGISSGFMPLAATVARDHVAAAFMGRQEDDVHFLHGNTFGGHPLACATGLAVIDELERLKLINHSRRMGERFRAAFQPLVDEFECIGDVRGAGMLWGIEFVQDRLSRTHFPREKALAPRVIKLALQNEGLILRGSQHVLQVAPPLVATEADIDQIVELIRRSIVSALAA